MKTIKLNDKFAAKDFSNVYTLDPTEKYVINLEEEMQFQLAIMQSFQIMGFPPAIKNDVV